jgi:hypothetical protein
MRGAEHHGERRELLNVTLAAARCRLRLAVEADVRGHCFPHRGVDAVGDLAAAAQMAKPDLSRKRARLVAVDEFLGVLGTFTSALVILDGAACVDLKSGRLQQASERPLARIAVCLKESAGAFGVRTLLIGVEQVACCACSEHLAKRHVTTLILKDDELPHGAAPASSVYVTWYPRPERALQGCRFSPRVKSLAPS